MALPGQFQTARMTGITPGKDIPTHIGALEGVICDAFGFTIDTNITASPTSSDNAGVLTKALLRQKAAAPVGIRILNSTASGEVRIVNNAGNLDFDYNSGTEGSPSWVNKFRMAIATGAINAGALVVTGATIGSLSGVLKATAGVVAGSATTTDLTEGTNLYYTQGRFDSAFAAKTTANLTENTNLYYTNARARAAISNTATGLTYTSGTGVLSLTSGYVIPETTHFQSVGISDSPSFTFATVGSLSIAAGKMTVDTNGNPTKINNVTICFPSSQGAAGSILGNDGSGYLSWGSPTLMAGATPGFYSNLKVFNNTGTPFTKIDITADFITVTTGAAFQLLSSVNLTVNTGTTGANGLDTGTLAATTWYYFYVIAKADGTKAGLCSLSASSPTMPSGYTYKKLVSAVKTDGSTHFFIFDQSNNDIRYRGTDSLSVLSLGGATTYTSIDLSGYVPPNIVNFVLFNGIFDILGDATGSTGSGWLSVDGANATSWLTSYSVNSIYNYVSGEVNSPINTSQTIYYKVSSGAHITSANLSLYVLGFRIKF
jgi:hypothetical protein